MDVHPADVAVAGIVEYVEATFRPLTAEKDLEFTVEVGADVPRTLYSDQHRLQQVLRNLLSNAVKFTSAGEVTLTIRHGRRTSSSRTRRSPRPSTSSPSRSPTPGSASRPSSCARSSRRSSRPTARSAASSAAPASACRSAGRSPALIGGEIHVQSDPGDGSTFTLYIPVRYDAAAGPELGVAGRRRRSRQLEAATACRAGPRDGRRRRGGHHRRATGCCWWRSPSRTCAGRRSSSAAVTASRWWPRCRPTTPSWSPPAGPRRRRRRHGHGHPRRRLAAPRPQATPTDPPHPDGRHAPRRTPPRMPTRAGWRARSTSSRNPLTRAQARRRAGRTRHLPGPPATAGCWSSPSRPTAQRSPSPTACPVLEGSTSTWPAPPLTRRRALDDDSYDCVVVDLGSSGGGGFEVLKRLRSRKALRAPPGRRRRRGRAVGARGEPAPAVRRGADAHPAATAGAALEALVAVPAPGRRAARPASWSRPPSQPREGEQMFVGKRILIVDDDVRNVFALTSALEQHGIEVVYAESGEAGLETLRREPEIDLVLMDVMMPGMDGYTAMREIRKMPSLRDLPGDRPDRQGDARRPRQQPHGRRVGLRDEAGRRRPAAVGVQVVAVVTEPRARILLVDDRPENLLALEAILSSLDQTLVRASSGEEALRELLKEDYALILLDAQMPGMDGFETAARIKRTDPHQGRADHLPDRGRQRAAQLLPGLRRRWRRLHREAVRPVDPPGQGAGVRRPVGRRPAALHPGVVPAPTARRPARRRRRRRRAARPGRGPVRHRGAARGGSDVRRPAGRPGGNPAGPPLDRRAGRQPDGPGLTQRPRPA